MTADNQPQISADNTARPRLQLNLTQNMIHEITRSEIHEVTLTTFVSARIFGSRYFVDRPVLVAIWTRFIGDDRSAKDDFRQSLYFL